jgi:hypothetical protein
MPGWDENLKRYLFTDGPILGPEEKARAGADKGAPERTARGGAGSGPPDLGLGSLRGGR